MDESEQNERLVAIVRRFYDYQPKTLLSFGAPPFDISRPNIHDSKPEFLAEKQAVDDAIRAAEALFEFLAGAWGEDKDTSALAIRVITAVDGEARFSSNTLPVETALGLIRRNAATHGLSYTMTALLADLAHGLTAMRSVRASKR
ncbi:hypothetical protein [Nioella aestuarii]|uniref:hypothetical protein n=1 Tax=Nioella aestuarii TaxID=1662864 RepID=UPI003D7F44F5